MDGNEEIAGKPEPKRSLRIDAERAAQIVRAVKAAREEPFGPLSLVRSVVRPVRREPT